MAIIQIIEIYIELQNAFKNITKSGGVVLTLPYWYKISRVLIVVGINCRAKILPDFATFSSQGASASGLAQAG